jgi:hypothetical protein
LGIAIAANAAVFGVLKSVVLTPRPFGEPDRLVTIAETGSGRPNGDAVSDETHYSVNPWRWTRPSLSQTSNRYAVPRVSTNVGALGTLALNF